jgi:hypothetical protein
MPRNRHLRLRVHALTTRRTSIDVRIDTRSITSLARRAGLAVLILLPALVAACGKGGGGGTGY